MKLIIFTLTSIFIYLSISTFLFTNKRHFTNKRERGYATWYGIEKDSQKTSTGGYFNILKFEATHPTYPIGSLILIKNLDTRKSTIVQINNNEEQIGNSIIDISFAAAKALGFGKKRYQRVEIQPLKNDLSEPFDTSKDNIKNKYNYERLVKERNNKDLFKLEEGKSKLENSEYFDTNFLEDESFQNNDEEFTIPKIVEKEEPQEYKKQPILKPQKTVQPNLEPNLQRFGPYQFLYGIPTDYTVQVAAFLSKKRSIDYRNFLLDTINKKVYILKENDFYKVLFGDFKNIQIAEQFRKELNKKNLENLKPRKFFNN